jgi:hypothetical protein
MTLRAPTADVGLLQTDVVNTEGFFDPVSSYRGALGVIEPCSIHNMSVYKSPTSAVGALGVIEPFSIHNICLSVRAIHQQ